LKEGPFLVAFADFQGETMCASIGTVMVGLVLTYAHRDLERS